jgi:aldehyde dehydrogenase (NAD+)
LDQTGQRAHTDR